ncbi:hypothetical protein GYMLUDRAFT_242591 [Collybiopsis luxurians FD-317 M1]|uniref:LysM domain-containing protein n=1 Tax=Collybiopsis luxurians FD-317 M1 TaxID=944289 RepID=A0A0D0C2R6_9AGAR|nr:hypothetical protein GYMLUDRAFT_242591 [Collybiopsis luxurians FD-317 M1]
MSISLCLACSSSLPPRPHEPIFTTQCCSKPICSSCISANPRLARYNPCLACLGGVDAVGSRSSKGMQKMQNVNLDGAVRDEDTFVLGDDEDSNEGGAPPPPYLEQSPSPQTQPENVPESRTNDVGTQSEYYLQRGDTLHGIALRFGIDARELCRLNKLSPSTLSTTPHLLHTRTVLLLPSSARTKDTAGNSLLTPKDANDAQDRLRAVRRTRERAEKRIQTITKEVDWRVAKAYVALAEEEDLDQFKAQHDLKQKENVGSKLGTQMGAGSHFSNLEMLALDRYLEDDEWEGRERREGRSIAIPSFPLTGRTENSVHKRFTWK